MMEAANSKRLTRSQQRASRRRQLQRRRNCNLWQGAWRGLATLGMASGLVWALFLPRWTLTDPATVDIRGDRLLSETALRELIDWEREAPLSLLLLQPDRLAQQLEARAPLDRVTVTRSLLPLDVTVTVAERAPVAATVPSGTVQQRETPPPTPLAAQPIAHPGYLDATGTWMPATAYTTALEPPQLKVHGYTARERERWVRLYTALSRTPFGVGGIDFRNPDNIILYTFALGPVHLGNTLNHLDSQLATLAQLHDALPAHPQASQIAYIDLKNPDAPAVRPRPKKT